MRIVSLCPSQTETLLALGLTPGHELVGRTDFCIHPKDQVMQIPNIGGTKNFNIERILALKPDLVIAEKEENPKDRTLKLAEFVPVKVTDVRSIQDALGMIRDLGHWTGRESQANQMIQEILEVLKTRPSPPLHNRVLYFIWKNPWMVAGPDTFIHSVLEWCGYQNLATELPKEILLSQRYPKMTIEEIRKLNPDVLLLSSEPYSFSKQDQLDLPDFKCKLVDGEIFSWYGVRMKGLRNLCFSKNIQS